MPNPLVSKIISIFVSPKNAFKEGIKFTTELNKGADLYDQKCLEEEAPFEDYKDMVESCAVHPEAFDGLDEYSKTGANFDTSVSKPADTPPPSPGYPRSHAGAWERGTFIDGGWQQELENYQNTIDEYLALAEDYQDRLEEMPQYFV